MQERSELPWYWKPRAAALPLLVVVALVAVNGLVQASFIQCTLIPCQAYSAWHIFEFADDRVVAPDTLALAPDTTDIAPDTLVAAPAPLVAAPDTTPVREVPNLSLIQTDSTTWADEATVRQAVRRRHTGRMLWAVVAMTNVVLCLVVALYCLFLLLSRWRHARSVPLILLTGGLVVLSFGSVYLLGSHPASHMFYVLDVFREMDRISTLPGTVGTPDVAGTMNALNVLNFTTVLFMVIASSALAVPSLTWYRGSSAEERPLAEAGSADPGLATLAASNRELRLLLNLGMLLLVGGTLRMSMGLNWAAAFVTEQSLAHVEAFTATLTTIMGAYFSLVLAAIYMPTAYVIRQRARYLAGLLHTSGEETAQALARTGLDFSVKATTLRIATIMTPLLSGPLSNLLSALVA